MFKPNTLIIRTAGINCDRELAHAFNLAGSMAHVIHLNRILSEPGLIADYELIAFPGGFSYGDDISAGRIFANRLRHHLFEPLLNAIERGVPMIGICNGFQVLVKLGLLPDPHDSGRKATLADNENPRFVDKWVCLQTDPDSPCVWTKGLSAFDLPIAHGEGRFVVDEQTLERLTDHGQVALRYANETNPNGSIDDIAGICDPTGLVLGLMPHPERFVDWSHHPQWTRRGSSSSGDDSDLSEVGVAAAGLRFFQNAVEHVRNTMAAAAG